MKHVQRRHFFVRDMVESLELVVPFVPTDENPADFLTKPHYNASKFYSMRAIVMNEPQRADATGQSADRQGDDRPRGGVGERARMSKCKTVSMASG